MKNADMKRFYFCKVLLLLGIGVSTQPAAALSVSKTLFCAAYPDSGLCVSGRTACTTCHNGTPPALNSYGADVRAEIATRPDYARTSADFERYLQDVLFVVETRDSDLDGFLNRDEIARGYAPGNVLEFPVSDDPGAYSPELALRRISTLYCGTSPTYQSMAALGAAADKPALLHLTLTDCLTSSYWLTEGLPRLADDKIRPVGSLGGSDGQALVGDFTYDYRLFIHAMSGDRDARDLLKADYHIAADGRVVRGVISGRGGQPLPAERRAGMLTTQWFIGNNTMFALLPRNTAAQAYRAYLGLDIARSEGLFPIDGEPRDHDRMRVGAPDCAVCHSTLDPLAYPFAPYMAFSSRRLDGSPRPGGIPIGGYDGTAPFESGFLMGNPVRNLLEWAEAAAETDWFKKTVAQGLYRHAIGHESQTVIERQEFAALWQAFAADGYSANKMLHRLIDSRSFGAVGPAARPVAVWKRHKQIARDLARAMQLPLAQVCKEVGTYSCADQVFLTVLGGNDPINKSQYRPAAAPTILTPIALERFVLSACSQRVELDSGGEPAVFNFIDLRKSSLLGDESEVDLQTAELYRRLHARDPQASELAAMRELLVADDGTALPALEFAKLACFIVGSSQEFLFN